MRRVAALDAGNLCRSPLQLKGPDGSLLHQIRNRQDGKFELALPTAVRACGAGVLRALRVLSAPCRGAGRLASATTDGTTRRFSITRSWDTKTTWWTTEKSQRVRRLRALHVSYHAATPTPRASDLNRCASSTRADQLQPVRDTLRSLRQTMRQLLEEQTYQTTRDSVHLASAFARLYAPMHAALSLWAAVRLGCCCASELT